MGSYSILGVQVDICFRVKSTEAELIKITAVLRHEFVWLFATFFLVSIISFLCFSLHTD